MYSERKRPAVVQIQFRCTLGFRLETQRYDLGRQISLRNNQRGFCLFTVFVQFATEIKGLELRKLLLINGYDFIEITDTEQIGDQPRRNCAVSFICSVHFLNEGIDYREVYAIFFISHIMPSHFFFFEGLQSCKYRLNDIPIAIITRKTIPLLAEINLCTQTRMFCSKVIVLHGKTNIPADSLSCNYDVTNISAFSIGILIDRENN